MRWQGERQSSNIEDRRGRRVGLPLAVGGGGSLIVALLYALLTGNPGVLVNGGGDGAYTQRESTGARDDQASAFVSTVLASTEDTWPAILQQQGVRYVDPKLVLFSDAVESACGVEQSAVGPFYCPNDSRVYLDTSFFDELARRFGAPGDFAQAYVIAHEVGHHVQNLLGISDQVHAAERRAGKAGANRLSVALELQADCFAGVWAHHAQQERHLLEPGDLEEGLAAASAVGDDKLQRAARGYVVPESFTHGSSAQRVQWFTRGFQSGEVNACNTFSELGLTQQEPVGRRPRGF